MRVDDNIKTTATDRRDDSTTVCLLDYLYFKENYKIIAIDMGKSKALDADPIATKSINFTGNLDQAGNTTMFFIIKKVKDTNLDFSQGTVKIL